MNELDGNMNQSGVFAEELLLHKAYHLPQIYCGVREGRWAITKEM